MESEEEFMSLAEAAFSKMEWVELECPDPEQSEFANLAAFLKDSHSDQFLQKLVQICAERFPTEEKVPDEESPEFLVTCRGSQEVFNVSYEGFWLISLLEAGKEQVEVNLESLNLKDGGLGPFVFMGVWGDTKVLARFSSHICRQQKKLSKLWLGEVRCITIEDGLALTKMMENSEEFEVTTPILYFNEATPEFWKALAEQLKRSPAKALHMNSRTMLDARVEDLREIWEFCILESMEIETLDDSYEIQIGKEEDWQKLRDILAKEKEKSDKIADNLEKFLTCIKEGQGATCPSGFPLKRVNKTQLHWNCDLCRGIYLIDYPWRCEECERESCNFDVDRDCMVKYAGEESAGSIGKRFAKETGLNFEIAMQKLKQSGLDFDEALEEFNEEKAEGKIPPEAYSEA